MRRGIIAGSYRKYASRECYRQHSSSLDRPTCRRGHTKQGRRCKTCSRAGTRVRKYGIPMGLALSAPENCEMCNAHENDSPWGTLTLDHDHETGEFRGWLCGHCNALLGRAEDNLIILRAAIKYLKRHGK